MRPTRSSSSPTTARWTISSSSTTRGWSSTAATRPPGSPHPRHGSSDFRARRQSRRSPHAHDELCLQQTTKMKLLVAGAAGFLGSHFVDRLLADGHGVIGVDSFITGHEDNLADTAGESLVELIRSDVSEPLDIRGIDGVLHLASPASPVDYLLYPTATLTAGS